MLPTYMRAVECATPGPVSVLQLRRIPLPVPQQGQALIRILAFGINRAGMHVHPGKGVAELNSEVLASENRDVHPPGSLAGSLVSTHSRH